MSGNLQLETLKSKLGIKEFDSVTLQQFENIQKLIATKEVKQEQIEMLIGVMPNFVQLQKEYIDGLKLLISSAKESQKDALQGISNTLNSTSDILKEILNKTETEELRLKIADIALQLANYGMQIAQIIHETNKDNNKMWVDIATKITAVLSVSMVFLHVLKEKKS